MHHLSSLEQARTRIVSSWVASAYLIEVLSRHNIDTEAFYSDYALGVFDYFMDVIRGKTAIGDCPVIGKLLEYFKDRDVSAEELFVICSHFRKAIFAFTYEAKINNGTLFEEISDLFDQNFSGVLGRYTDTIFQKEQEIAKNVQLLSEYKRAIDESAIVSKTDIYGEIIYINDNFTKRCGYSEEELVGTRHNIVWNDEALFKRIYTKMAQGEVFHDTVRNRKKNGEYYYVDMTMLPIIGFNGEITEYMEISYEVTSLIEATREAVAAGEAREYFLSNMSHEIRTPLNAILGFVSLLGDEVTSERHRQYLNIVHNSGENLLSIINDILDFSKLQSGEFAIEPHPFNIHEELSKTLELFVPSANEKQITILSYFDPQIPHILVSDILRIKQIVSNFISNAIKFSAHSSLIEARVTCKDEVLKIAIEDWGIGLNEEDIDRIFDPFSQAKSSVEQLVGGTGLGLSICKKLAEHMHGNITVKSQKGVGSTFTLSVPVVIQECSDRHLFDPEPFKKLRIAILRCSDKASKTLESLEYYLDFFKFSYDRIGIDAIHAYELVLFLEDEIASEVDHLLLNSTTAMIAIMEHLDDRYDNVDHITPLFFPFYCAKIYSAFQNSQDIEGKRELRHNKRLQRRFNGRVLVAEDNSANQELIRVVLERYGLNYSIVEDGAQAIEAYKVGDFNLILMDEQMPVKNGLEATRDILDFEAQNNLIHTPIVAITANVIKGAKERGMEYGYDAFLGKPIILKEIERVFEHYLQEQPAQTIELTDSNIAMLGTGIDLQRLQKELQLEPDNLKMLLNIYAKKMRELLPKLDAAIAAKDFAAIAKNAHAIKGSSANFRFEELQRLAAVIEESATQNDTVFEYEEACEVLRKSYEQLNLHTS